MLFERRLQSKHGECRIPQNVVRSKTSDNPVYSGISVKTDGPGHPGRHGIRITQKESFPRNAAVETKSSPNEERDKFTSKAELMINE